MKKRYKFLKSGYKSEHGNFKWKFGKWYTHEGKLDICNSGFHCSKGIYQAFKFAQGSILAQVEVKGKSIIETNKEVWEEMRIIKSWRWSKKDSVLFSIYVAELVLDNFESKFPNDKRPRQAIEAAKNWCKNPTKKNKELARSACLAHSAYSSVHSIAYSVAYSAHSTARSAAYSAAHSTARSAARSAAHSAYSSVYPSASSVIYRKLDNWMLKHLSKLKVMTA